MEKIIIITQEKKRKKMHGETNSGLGLCGPKTNAFLL